MAHMSNITHSPCPLCGYSEVRILERIRAEDLARAWRRSYGIEVGEGLVDCRYVSCRRCQLGFFHPMQAGGAGLYEQLQRHDWYYVDDKPEYAIAARWLPAEGEVLEVGSGKAAFAQHVGAARYRGLEFNEVAVERARAAGITLEREPIQSHADRRPGVYRAVVSFQVLEHVPDPATFVRACVRALHPDQGRLILAVPDHDGLCGTAQNNILDLPPHHATHWTERTLRELAAINDLEVLAIEREPVSTLHADWARRASIERQWRRRLGLQDRLLDMRWGARIIGRLASILAARSRGPVGQMSGHTIVGVFRKQ